MNSTETSDVFPKRKKTAEIDFNYCSSKKKSKLDEPDEDEDKQTNKFVGYSRSETKEVKTVKASSSIKNFGKQYMLKHGYVEGSGLGKHQNGIVEPVEASKQRGRRGLGFQPTDLTDAIAKFDPTSEEVLVDEEVEWLSNDYSDSLDKECLESWVKIGSSISSLDSNSQFCDITQDIFSSKNLLNAITIKDLENGRGRSNPFESIRNGIFLNRAAMKMANLDAILDWMFTEPKTISGEKVIQPNELLYFADVCAGPGGFSEYVLYRKKWRAKGFGFTLRQENDFTLHQFWAGPSESFEPHYGEKEDGNVYAPENIISFRDHVLKHTDDKGVHFMMADGGVHIDEKFNDQELICKKLYLCQCLVALLIVRTGGHFVVKLFDLFTEFSVGLIYLMYRSFKKISIIKPNTSRPANSERYLVCKWKREDCSDIGEHLFEINNRVPEFNQKHDTSLEDVLELVPTDLLFRDSKFIEYIIQSNNKLGKRQILSLIKLATFSEHVDLQEERQQELRKVCLKKWNIPDEARAEPKKYDARTTCMKLLGNSSLFNQEYDIRKNTIDSVECFKQVDFAMHSWYCLILSGEESNNCTFYLGLGRNSVQKYESGKWTKLWDSRLCLPMNTLVYGEIVNEYLGTGRSQRKISAFHIIDGLFLGREDIRDLPFRERLKVCELFAKSLYKETCPVRVKAHYPLPEIDELKKRLVLKSTKSCSLKTLFVPLGADTFFKAGGIMFIRDTRDNWNRHFSRNKSTFYLFEKKTGDSKYETDVKGESVLKYYGDFEYCFRTKLIWWWDEEIIQDRQRNHSDPNKLHWENIMNCLKIKN